MVGPWWHIFPGTKIEEKNTRFSEKPMYEMWELSKMPS